MTDDNRNNPTPAVDSSVVTFQAALRTVLFKHGLTAGDIGKNQNLGGFLKLVTAINKPLENTSENEVLTGAPQNK